MDARLGRSGAEIAGGTLSGGSSGRKSWKCCRHVLVFRVFVIKG